MNFLYKMSEAQKEELKTNIKRGTDLLAFRRAQAIIMLEERLPIDTILSITGYRKEVIVKLRRLFITKGYGSLFSKRKKKSPKTLLTRSQKKQIIETINTTKPSNFGFNSYSFWTTAVLGYLIKEQYHVEYKSKTSLYLIFKQARFSFRKPEKQSEKRNEQQIAEWKKKYEPIIKEECAREDSIVLVGDEMVLTSETRLQKVWLPKDQPAFIEDTSKRKTTHIYGFLNIQSGAGAVFQAETQTGETTVSILKKLTEKYPDKRIVIFWDNASWHKSAIVKEYLESTTHFQLYNFPPYAPDLNPQEHVWKEIRSKVLNNRLITDIDKAAKQLIRFVNDSLFEYRFFGLHGTFNM